MGEGYLVIMWLVWDYLVSPSGYGVGLDCDSNRFGVAPLVVWWVHWVAYCMGTGRVCVIWCHFVGLF